MLAWIGGPRGLAKEPSIHPASSFLPTLPQAARQRRQMALVGFYQEDQETGSKQTFPF